MAVGWHRPTRLLIDQAAITKNVSNECQRLPEDTELFAVVKANGYGHGAVQTAYAAQRGGATGFCVALLDEALELRQAGITAPILILNVIDPKDVKEALRYHLSVTVADDAWLKEAAEELKNESSALQLAVHIKVDTGMSRLGFTTVASVLDAVSLIQAHACFHWEGIYTHFATADEVDGTYFEKQFQQFQTVLRQLPFLPKYVHESNSATALWHPETRGNLVRYGIAMYGLNPSSGRLQPINALYPALRLETELMQVKKVAKNTSVGYGKTYTTAEEEWIGTLPIGYADGWLRNMQGFSVLVEGEFCEIIGRVCMDQCMIRLPRQMKKGTKVTLIGQDGDKEITMQMVAEQLNTIHYEVACTFSARIPRDYT